jgi:anti-anti-sigma factor
MMQIQVDESREPVCISLTGKMWSPKDLAELEIAVIVLKDKQYSTMILDMSGISFISSHGLGFLVKLGDMVQKAGKKMILYQPREEIQELIELSAVNKVIPLVMNDEELAQALA